MGYFYAQIDGDGICFCVSQLAGEVDDPRCVRIDAYDEGLLGKRYCGGDWVD